MDKIVGDLDFQGVQEVNEGREVECMHKVPASGVSTGVGVAPMLCDEMAPVVSRVGHDITPLELVDKNRFDSGKPGPSGCAREVTGSALTVVGEEVMDRVLNAIAGLHERIDHMQVHSNIENLSNKFDKKFEEIKESILLEVQCKFNPVLESLKEKCIVKKVVDSEMDIEPLVISEDSDEMFWISSDTDSAPVFEGFIEDPAPKLSKRKREVEKQEDELGQVRPRARIDRDVRPFSGAPEVSVVSGGVTSKPVNTVPEVYPSRVCSVPPSIPGPTVPEQAGLSSGRAASVPLSFCNESSFFTTSVTAVVSSSSTCSVTTAAGGLVSSVVPPISAASVSVRPRSRGKSVRAPIIISSSDSEVEISSFPRPIKVEKIKAEALGPFVVKKEPKDSKGKCKGGVVPVWNVPSVSEEDVGSGSAQSSYNALLAAMSDYFPGFFKEESVIPPRGMLPELGSQEGIEKPASIGQRSKLPWSRTVQGALSDLDRSLERQLTDKRTNAAFSPQGISSKRRLAYEVKRLPDFKLTESGADFSLLVEPFKREGLAKARAMWTQKELTAGAHSAFKGLEMLSFMDWNLAVLLKNMLAIRGKVDPEAVEILESSLKYCMVFGRAEVDLADELSAMYGSFVVKLRDSVCTSLARNVSWEQRCALVFSKIADCTLLIPR